MRLALLPLTLRLARQARAQQARIATIKPQIDAIQRRHAAEPARLMRETQALYAANDIRVVTAEGLVGLLVQMPLLGGLFAAVRSGLGAGVPFLWIANVARPDALLLGVVTLLSGAVVAMPRPQAAAGAPNALAMFVIGAGGALFFLWSASSAVALSVGAGTLVSGLQGWLVARDGARGRRAA